MTKQKYAEALRENIETLSDKITSGGWRPKPARQVMIPKPTGGWRPLAVGCLEDKIVQLATTWVLNAIYETEFAGFSYGFLKAEQGGFKTGFCTGFYFGCHICFTGAVIAD